MKKIIWSTFLIFAFLSFKTAQAQVGVGTTTPEGALDIVSSTQGFLPPRVSLTNLGVAAPVTNPKVGSTGLASGTIVYHDGSNSITAGYYFWNGSGWQNLASSSVSSSMWAVTGNTGTTAPGNFIGTTDNNSFAVRTNNTECVRISNTGNTGFGTTTPTALIHMKDGHIKSEQTNPPSLSIIVGAGITSATLNPASTDIRGLIDISGTTSSASTVVTIRITFNISYSSVPLPFLTLANDAAQDYQAWITNVTTSSFDIKFKGSNTTNPRFAYFVIE